MRILDLYYILSIVSKEKLFTRNCDIYEKIFIQKSKLIIKDGQ